MDERYTRLFALSEKYYAEGAPLLIAAGALLKDNRTGKVLAQIKFKNISPKTIKAVKVSVKAFDVSGAELQGVKEYQYLDLNAVRDMEFGQKNAIVLPDDVTRSFSCECTSVVFSDGTSWEANGAEWRTLIQPQKLQKKLGGLAAQYQRETIGNAQFVTTNDRDLWICACGEINRQDEEKCHACRSEKSALLSKLDIDALKEHDAAFQKEESEKKAKSEARQKEKKQKYTKIGIIAAACAVVVIAAIVVIAQVIVPSVKYNSAVSLMDEGKYDEAIAAFEEIVDYKDSRPLLKKCNTLLIEKEQLAEKEECYQKAIDLFSVCNYDEAITAFESLNGYKDSKDKIESIKSVQSDIYNTAKRLFISKKYTDALKEFNRVKEYKNSAYYIEYCEVYERFNGKWTWEDLSIDTHSNVYRSHYNPYQTYYIDVESKTITLDFQSPLISFKKTNNFEIISSDSIRCDSFMEDSDDSLYWYYTKNGIMVSSSSSMY